MKCVGVVILEEFWSGVAYTRMLRGLRSLGGMMRVLQNPRNLTVGRKNVSLPDTAAGI